MVANIICPFPFCIFYFATGQPVLLLNYQQLNYDSPPIANKFSFIILQNKHTASSFLRLITATWFSCKALNDCLTINLLIQQCSKTL